MDEEHGAIEQRPRLWFSFCYRVVVGHGERGLPVTSHVPRAAWRRAISHLRVSRPAVSSRRVCTYMLACQRSAGMSLEYEAIGQYEAIVSGSPWTLNVEPMWLISLNIGSNIGQCEADMGGSGEPQ